MEKIKLTLKELALETGVTEYFINKHKKALKIKGKAVNSRIFFFLCADELGKLKETVQIYKKERMNICAQNMRAAKAKKTKK